MKRKLKTFLTSFLAALFMATLVVPIIACTNDDGGSGSGHTHVDVNGDNICDNCGETIDDSQIGNEGDTIVTVASMANKGLEGVTVRATNAGNVVSGVTNADGKVALALDNSLKYQVTFDNLPNGYYTDADADYSIKANNTEDVKFYLPSKVIKGATIDPTYVYKTGDVMYDFSFNTTVGGTEVTLSKELDPEIGGKKAVIINFWGSLCSNCQLEFPAIESTYQMFEEDLSVMAIVPPYCYGDTDAKIIKQLADWRLNLSFYYGLDKADLYKNVYAPAQNAAFSLPVSVIVDRYGILCEIIVGSETDAQIWQNSIAYYVSDEYVPKVDLDKDSEGVENFVPDKPSDFNAQMSDSVDIDKAINKTGTDILFYADDGEYSWPWALSSDGKSIVPLGSGHGRSYSIIYASINIPVNKALLVDYRISSQEYYDLFEIVVDYNDLGKVSFEDSGNKDWATALAYVPLSPGLHEIAFVYYKGTIKGENEDTVYLNNLRFVDVTDTEKIPSSDISYFAARDFDGRNGVYKTYEDYYFDATDGYYHVKGRESAGKDPYLLLDMTHIIPYTRSSSLYEQYISPKDTTFGTKNYYNELMSYSYVSANSAIEGTVPVTKELHDIIDALCKHEAEIYGYEYSDKSWLEFCVFYLHYGKGNYMDDPAKGLAYFSAYEAELTDVYDTATAREQINAIYAAQEAKAAKLKQDANADTSAEDKIIADNTKAYEDNLKKYNSVDFDTIMVPRGKVVKFTAQEDGVYHFYSVGREDNPEYICEAQLFDKNLNLHTALARPIASHDSDTLFRDGSPSQFHLYHYLKAGESCYINVMFYSTETMDTMYYAVNKVSDTDYSVLKTVTAGFLTTSLDPDTLGQLYRPSYTKVSFNSSDNYYYADNGTRIVVDFTGVTRFSTSHTLKQVIDAAASGNPLKMGSMDVTFDLTGVTVKIGNETLVGQDYTARIQEILNDATSNPNDPAYGLVEANKELRDILTLFIYKYDELIIPEEEWLNFCYFYEYFGPAK